MIHSHPNEWPESILNTWLKVIKETEGLAFNPDTVPGDIVMKSLNINPKK
jgi:hypothetical protein